MDADIERLLLDCSIRRIKRGGPGGQHRNKTASAVVLKHLPSGIVAEANERRDQSVNLQQAVRRLRMQLALEVRTVRKSWPSPLWCSRCRQGRVRVDPNHEDFPQILAEVLDLLTQADDDLQKTAKELGCTQSQLVKLLSIDARALGLVNGRRRAHGWHALRGRT